MKGPSRASIRTRRFIRSRTALLRRVPELGLLTIAGLIIAGIVLATAPGADWPGILRSEALNLVAIAILALFAYLLWIARFRNAQLPAYLDRFRRGRALEPQEAPDQLVAVIVEELLDARPPLACLVVGPREAARSKLLADVAEQLASQRGPRARHRRAGALIRVWLRTRSVPVFVDVAAAVATDRLPILMRDRFVERLVGSTGDPQNGRRLFAHLVRRRKLVGLVKGLDRVASERPLDAQRTAISDLLQTSVDEGIPFVACVDEGLAPTISEVAAFRVGPMPIDMLVRYAIDRLEMNDVLVDHPLEEFLQTAFQIADPTRDPTFLNLAIDLVIRRTRRGEVALLAARELFARQQAFLRHLEWMCEWALDCPIDEVGKQDSPAALALAALGLEAQHAQRSEVELDDVLNGLGADDRRRVTAGVSSLSASGVIDRFDAGKRLRFSHPSWLGFAGSVGLRWNEARWADLLRSYPSTVTLDALTGALWMFGDLRRANRSFVRVLDGLLPHGTGGVSLEMALAVIRVLQTGDGPLRIQDDERTLLERAWRSSDDVVRKKFIFEVDLGAEDNLIAFLWSQVVPPRFGENKFAVRRAICRRLGGLGNAAWQTLGHEWIDLIERAASIDLSSWSRRAAKRQRKPWPGSAVASLAWVLPQLLLSATGPSRTEAFELLAELRELIGPPGDHPASRGIADIGLEISLAEGFKAAAIRGEGQEFAGDDAWLLEAFDLLESSRSWISQQALLQALGLASPERLRPWLLDNEHSSKDRHPFAREAAALVSRRIDSQIRASVKQDIWLDDQEALADGGVSLSKEAHRLLGLSTLLTVMGERLFQDWIKDEPGATDDAVELRERAFVKPSLPKCFSERRYAETMFDKVCDKNRMAGDKDRDCPYGFCGPGAKGPILEQQRLFSRSFVQRAQVTADLPTVAHDGGQSILVTKGFGQTWHELDDELILAERRAAGS